MKAARAHPNIALVKYWGKRDLVENIPANPSLSITLGGLYVITRVEEAGHDEFILNGERKQDQKILGWLTKFRETQRTATVRVVSTSNFPASSGLASSAAGFAALTVILNEHFQLNLGKSDLDRWARLGSASAARSLYEGFVTMQVEEDGCKVQSIMGTQDWPLSVVVAITSSNQKLIPSSEGMLRTAETSPFYQNWVESTPMDFNDCVNAVMNRDFDRLSQIAERSCRKMHALMWTTEPPLMYWNPATLECIQLIHQMGNDGVPVFYTVDAGPQVKAVCPPPHGEEVERLLKGVVGVRETIRSEMGNGATCVDVDDQP